MCEFYDQTIAEYFFGMQRPRRRKPLRPEGDVGLELEMEGLINITNPEKLKWWQQHEEGSLKDGGTELVLTRPVSLEELPQAIDEARAALSKSKIKQSLRTSTHVHVNMLSRTVRQLYSVILAWWIIEDSIIQTQGPNRVGNLFCLSLSNAEAILFNILADLDGRRHLNTTSSNSNRYAALNLSAIGKFGSVEFRFLKGTTDWDEITMWTESLHQFVNEACRMSWDEVVALADAPPVTILKRFFPTRFIKMVLTTKPLSWFKDAMKTNRDSIAILHYELTRVDRRTGVKDFGDDDDERYMKGKTPPREQAWADEVGLAGLTWAVPTPTPMEVFANIPQWASPPNIPSPVEVEVPFPDEQPEVDGDDFVPEEF